MSTSIAFATVLHDPDALLVGPIEATAPALTATFSGVAVSLTEATDPSIERIMVEMLGARVTRHRTGEEFIGLGRRSAVSLALEFGTERVLYADPDHMLHWLSAHPGRAQRRACYPTGCWVPDRRTVSASVRGGVRSGCSRPRRRPTGRTNLSRAVTPTC